MKEAYFTVDNLQSAGADLLQELYPHGQRRKGSFNPEKGALLILDMQEYFLDPNSHAFIPSAAAVIPHLKQLSRQFAQRQRPVICTQHLNTRDDAGNMNTWWQDLITREHPLQGIIPDFVTDPTAIIQKSQYDAFFESQLQDRLQSDGVEQVVIGGVMTHLCCETTARSAFVRGYEVFFLVDGTATYSRDFHVAALRNLGHGFATLVRALDIMASFTVGDG